MVKSAPVYNAPASGYARMSFRGRDPGMSRSWIKRAAVVAVAMLLTLGGWAGLRSSSRPGIEIRGKLSSNDVAQIRRLHRSVGQPIWPNILPKWFAPGLRREITSALSPIEIIAVPSDGRAIVVYRGFERYYYDKKGRHRWGDAAYTVAKDSKGWHVIP